MDKAISKARPAANPNPGFADQRHWVIGTAGHVDHGKTTLVKALTGVDTDRLPEEKLREMTIDLGFAQVDLPSGRTASLVDVPGHERFIGNMLAGATGIDLVLFVVAADEGVMPQTIEHLDILGLLGLGAGIVVITKADLVDEEWLAIVREDVSAAVRDTFLAAAPVLDISATTGQGLESLRRTIDGLLDDVKSKPVFGPARLPVDRVFTIAGFGTVVTGTMVSGTIAVGDQLELLPESRGVRVRSVQVHGAPRDRAFAGERVALNLAGLERAEVLRGEVLATPGRFRPTTRFDGRLHYTDRLERDFKTRSRVHLHIGTSEVVGRLLLLEGDVLQPGAESFVQFHSESPIVIGPRDRFIIRSYSPRRTIGGGLVIDADPAFRRSRPKGRRAASLLAALRVAEAGDPLDLVAAVLAARPALFDLAEITAQAEADYGMAAAAVAPALATLVERDEALRAAGDEGIYAAVASFDVWGERAREFLGAYHRRHPLRVGATREETRVAVVPELPPRRYPALLSLLTSRGVVAEVGDRLRLPDFAVAPSGRQQAVIEGLAAAYLAAGAAPPDVPELAAAVVPPAAGRTAAGSPPDDFAHAHEFLLAQGVIVRVKDGVYFHRAAIEAAAGLLREHLGSRGAISVSEFRQAVGTTRKYALPLLEYFDGLRITRRQGDDRVPGAAFSAEPGTTQAAAASVRSRPKGDETA